MTTGLAVPMNILTAVLVFLTLSVCGLISARKLPVSPRAVWALAAAVVAFTLVP